MALRVRLMSAGWTVRSSGYRSASTFCTSTGTSVRGMTASGLREVAAGSSPGTTSDTYFSPNSVFGTIAPVTLLGIVCS